MQGGESIASLAFAPPTTICISADGMNTVPAATAEMATNVSIIRHVPGPGCRKVVRRPGGTVSILRQYPSVLQTQEALSASALICLENHHWRLEKSKVRSNDKRTEKQPTS